MPGLTIAVRGNPTGRPAPKTDGSGPRHREAEFRFDGGISEFCAHLATGEPVTDVHAADRLRHVHRDRPGARRPRPHDPDRGRARAARRRGGPVGDRLRHDDPLVRERDRHPARRHARHRLRAGPGPHAERAAPRGPAAEERRRAGHQGGHPRGHDRGRLGPAARAAVRGPDQGGARHPGRVQDRRSRSSARSSRTTSRTRRAAPSSRPARVLDKVVAAAKTRIAAREHRENQRRKSALASSTLPAKLVDCRSADDRSELFIVEGDSRPRHRQDGPGLRVPGAAADPRQDPQRAEVVAGRHAEERRVRRDHPGTRCRLGQHVRPGLGPLPARHLHGGRRRGRRAHPHPAAHPVPPLHAADAGGGPGVRRRPAAAPHRADQPAQGPGQVHLHLLRR